MTNLPIFGWYWCRKNAVWARKRCKHAKCSPQPHQMSPVRPSAS